MRIGIEIQRLFRKRKFGIESSALELIKALQAVGTDHEFVVFAKNGDDKSCLSPAQNLKIKTLDGKMFADFEQFFLPIAASREHVDILHCTGNTTPYFCRVPIVQTLHDVIFMDAIPSEDTWYQRFGNHYRRKIVPLVTPRSQVVITVSQYEKKRISERLKIDPERIHVVYNGINEKRFHNRYDTAAKKTVREKYHLPEEFILFLGNPAARKNPGRVIEAYVQYARGCDTPMAIVTPGLPEKFIRQKLAELKYSYSDAQFVSPGYIADEDLPALYTASKMFLFPSISEGFGLPVVEAMACGTPVITSSISCLPEIAGDAAMLTNPLDASEIAAAIQRLSYDEEHRMNMIAAGLLNAKRFSWTKTAQSVLGLYEMVYQKEKSKHKVPGFFHKHVFATRD